MPLITGWERFLYSIPPRIYRRVHESSTQIIRSSLSKIIRIACWVLRGSISISPLCEQGQCTRHTLRTALTCLSSHIKLLNYYFPYLSLCGLWTLQGIPLWRICLHCRLHNLSSNIEPNILITNLSPTFFHCPLYVRMYCATSTQYYLSFTLETCRRVDVRQDTWPKIQKYTVFVFDTSIWILKGVTCTQKSNGFFGWEKIEKFGFQFGKWNRPLNLVWVPSIRVHSNNYFRYKNCHC